MFTAALFTTAKIWKPPSDYQQMNGQRRYDTHVLWNIAWP